ncbi:hypothetical protein [Brevibacillus choshinensis]|uniref:Uncharacterized protein n=1 Tax=Brevibacillus choshinensis TaxID=54911 RepID=A0ABX7FTS3_BRECH|nr:hypothetical protein [Brevibacillus choshinensis]QRG69119.1 hypothetical protein JNE38_08280 [Brevibacillus choshinensis]
MEKLTEYYWEQSQKNTGQLLDMMKQTVTASVETLNRQQEEAQKFIGRLTSDRADLFVKQLETLQEQQVAVHKEIEQQFRSLMHVFQQEGAR